MGNDSAATAVITIHLQHVMKGKYRTLSGRLNLLPKKLQSRHQPTKSSDGKCVVYRRRHRLPYFISSFTVLNLAEKQSGFCGC